MQKSLLSKMALVVLVAVSVVVPAQAGVVAKGAKVAFGVTKATVGTYAAVCAVMDLWASKNYAADVTSVQSGEFVFEPILGNRIANRWVLTAFEAAKAVVFASTAVSGVADVVNAVIDDADADIDGEDAE
jgi:hypothetical protein